MRKETDRDVRSRRGRAQVFAAVAILAALPAFGAEIVLESPVRSPGGTFQADVSFLPAAGDAIAALQFDVRYDPASFHFAGIAAGGAASGAGKETVYSEPAPGTIRVVVAGFNEDSIGAGDLASLMFSPTDKASSLGASALKPLFADVVASNSVGERQPVTAIDGWEEEDAADSTGNEADAADDAAANSLDRTAAASTASNADVPVGDLGRYGSYGSAGSGIETRTRSQRSAGSSTVPMPGDGIVPSRGARRASSSLFSDDGSPSGNSPSSGRASEQAGVVPGALADASPSYGPRGQAARYRSPRGAVAPGVPRSRSVSTGTGGAGSTSFLGDVVLLAVGVGVLALVSCGVFVSVRRKT